MASIRLKDIRKTYEDGVTVIDKMNLEINYKELHCMEVIFKEYTDLIEYAKDIDIYDKYYK